MSLSSSHRYLIWNSHELTELSDLSLGTYNNRPMGTDNIVICSKLFFKNGFHLLK